MIAKASCFVGAVTGFAFDWVSTKVVGELAIEFYQNSGLEFIDQLSTPNPDRHFLSPKGTKCL